MMPSLLARAARSFGSPIRFAPRDQRRVFSKFFSSFHQPRLPSQRLHNYARCSRCAGRSRYHKCRLSSAMTRGSNIPSRPFTFLAGLFALACVNLGAHSTSMISSGHSIMDTCQCDEYLSHISPVVASLSLYIIQLWNAAVHGR
jgi:hypothetical protein